MTKTNQNFEMWAGDYKELIFTVTDASSGSGTNMAGMTACWGLYSDENGTASLLKKAGAIAGSLVTVTLIATDTDDLSGMYFHELQLTDGSNRPATVATGWGKFNKSVVS